MADDARLIAADRRARERALDVSRSFIVQAPAGSGKTELLIQRYLRLLSVVEHPEEILAITFTRKAAFEMQVRIVTALREARHGADAPDTHRRTTLEAARQALARDATRGWRLLESPHRLRIQTIDALNAAIARSSPIGSGLGAGSELAADDAIRDLYSEAAAATLDWLGTGGDDGAAVETLLVHLDNNSASYIAHLAGMLASRDQWLGITGIGRDRPVASAGVRARLEGNFAAVVSSQLRKVAGLVPQGILPALLRLGRYAAANVPASPHPLEALHDCRELPAAAGGDVARWRAFAELLLTRGGAWRRTVNRHLGFPPHDEGQKHEMLALLAVLSSDERLAAELHRIRRLPPARYSDEQWSVLLALIRLLPLAVAELRRIFSERRVTDYVEVAMAADAALGSVEDPGDIALLLDYRVSHLLIDEMQDTSIAQYGLLKKLVLGWQQGDGRTLFCVGDPMQSIYRFRNAEVGEFLVAQAYGLGDVPLESLRLRRNFRSGERLVRWFNSVFTGMFPRVDDVTAGAISYSESVPVEAHRGEGRCRVHPLFGGGVDEEAACGLRAIEQCLGAAEDQSTAVLVRSRSQLPPLLGRLRAAGIAYHALDIDRLTDLPEMVDLLALTRAISHGADRLAWLGLLRGPWVGLTWSDLHALVVNDTRHTVWELLHDPRRVAALSADGAVRIEALRRELAPLLQGHGVMTLQERVELAWYRLGGPCMLERPAEIDAVYRFLDLLEGMETAGTLTDVAELERRLDAERAPSGGPPGTRLQIMTMHRAKGLQFDHVILYGLGHRAVASQKPVLSWLNLPDRQGGSDLLISPLGARAERQSDALHDMIEAQLREKDRLEQDRLLYVACTRARRSLHLIGQVPLDPDAGGFREPPAGSLLKRLWPSVRDEYAAAFGAGGGVFPIVASDSRHLRQPALVRLSPFLPRPELPPLPAPVRTGAPAEPAVDAAVEYYWVGTTARQAGSIVHRFLQRLADGRLSSDGLGEAALAPVARRWAAELGVPAAEVEEVCGRACDAIARMLADETGRWILFGPGHAELALTGEWEGRVESVVIDRIRKDKRGVHWIIDYKTGTHEGGDLERFLKQEVARYRPQLRRYAGLYRALSGEPVRAALYFPLLQQWREVDLGAPFAA